MAKSTKLCWECQMRLVDYRTTITGQPLKHGLCRDCFERRAARHPGSGPPKRDGRTDEMKELTRETKFGTAHG